MLFVFIAQITLGLKADTCFSNFERDTIRCEAIFVGKVVDVVNNKFFHFGEHKKIFTFELYESYKGMNPYASYVSVIGPIGGCCNHSFIKDSVYLVFAYGNDILYTNDYSSSGLLSNRLGYQRRLGNSIIHKENLWQREKILREEIITDSVKVVNSKLKEELQILNNKSKTQIRIQSVLVIVIILFIFLLFFSFKYRK